MSVLIQDGRRGGHLLWARQAIDAGLAQGIVISPFHTPRIARPHHQGVGSVVSRLEFSGAEILLDPTTHGRLLPGANDLSLYETWQLWGPSGLGLDTEVKRLEHVQRVFEAQRSLNLHTLAPTLTLDGPAGSDAESALATAHTARDLDTECYQALAGHRAFWRAGIALDAYVGQLAELRSPCWIVTCVNETVDDNMPDFTDTDAFEGLLRTVHSLSLRSRVILCHSDYGGLPAVAAGADTVGAGWDRGMRYFDPVSFRLTAEGIRRPASYVTQGGLLSVLRRDTAHAIERVIPDADRLRGGPMPADDAAERVHHLRQLAATLDELNSHQDRRTRISALRQMYEAALTDYDLLLGELPGSLLSDSHRRRWVGEPLNALRAYATAEQMWS